LTANAKTNGTPRRNNRQRQERIMAMVALTLMVLVWIVSAIRAEADLLPAMREAMPEADHFERTSNGMYAAWADSEQQDLLGYVAVGSASGYGGPIELAVAVDLTGQITGLSVVNHKETPSWYDRVQKNGFLDTLAGKSYSDQFTLGLDVDGVTSATYTSNAIVKAAQDGSHAAARQLGLEVIDPDTPSIAFGLPEATVLALFIVGFFGHQRRFKYKKQARWGSMIVGLIVLGFMYNAPFTIAYFVKLILGYWPQWQTNLYWYFLLGGILFVVTADNKNPYCEWFCPFGAAQDCMGAIGGARAYSMRKHRDWLRWMQRIVALAAVLLGIFFRNPGLASFEIFGTLFSFMGTSIMFVVLAMVLVTALFVKRPWCNFLCPIRPVVEFINIMRKWILELWQRINPRTKTS
jgi:NosR/NirI family transcriptional regulator, nitrous oxide reductase regulator